MKSKKKIVACNLKCIWANQLFTKKRGTYMLGNIM
jgi:hypothetical protein